MSECSHQLVVAAVIVDSLSSPTSILAARRTYPPALAGQWEFPGGKALQTESAHEALKRELLEELGVQIILGEEVFNNSGSWTISHKYSMRLFLAAIESGVPKPLVAHDRLEWVPIGELDRIQWLPADQQAITAVRLLTKDKRGRCS
ncbi:(deoxy)nucleoside triphosphate pyrophosphohydrolase [Tsukamurella hominis]|uniref:(deoxy)nucleoside triphosphate pyrophosphohydrolase n=1 Tax=Tsukamurella hominis TaxID=1970232 RepID=UPI0039EB2A5F